MKKENKKEGRQVYMRAWAKANRDKLKANSKRWFAKNKKQNREATKKWREANKDKCLTYKRDQYQKDKKKILAKAKELRDIYRKENGSERKIRQGTKRIEIIKNLDKIIALAKSGKKWEEIGEEYGVDSAYISTIALRERGFKKGGKNSKTDRREDEKYLQHLFGGTGVLQVECHYCNKTWRYAGGRKKNPSLNEVKDWMKRTKCPYCGRRYNSKNVGCPEDIFFGYDDIVKNP